MLLSVGHPVPFNQFVALWLDRFKKTAAHAFDDQLRAISPWA